MNQGFSRSFYYLYCTGPTDRSRKAFWRTRTGLDDASFGPGACCLFWVELVHRRPGHQGGPPDHLAASASSGPLQAPGERPELEGEGAACGGLQGRGIPWRCLWWRLEVPLVEVGGAFGGGRRCLCCRVRPWCCCARGQAAQSNARRA